VAAASRIHSLAVVTFSDDLFCCLTVHEEFWVHGLSAAALAEAQHCRAAGRGAETNTGQEPGN